ncbi:hypothetical protein [Actinoplanes flavus]|uniref:Peptidoglycan binding domain-containing protein n=1 Tax=Actinoplanes flavus TaxID=2820290 RepID=A0ABS3UXB6_9ACTN|nr:hypothetical protein [Actinoplanes flavus]MBO3743233.1 hypothetical protein [Actinoplanes flavus]
MTDAYLDDLIRRLTSGEDPGRIQRSLLTREVRETLRRCAVARTFDRAVHDQVLCSPGGPDVATMLRDGYAEPIPGPGSLFRLGSDVRQEWLEDWPPSVDGRVPEGIVALSGRLADAYAERGDGVEELYHRALSDPGGAAALFTRLFADADARFDLAACQDVLDTVSEPGRLAWLDPVLTGLRADRHAYLRARSFWSTEWLQSARYLQRPSVDRHLERLIADDRSRALQLHARGGSGKTMLLRWFIARRCVPEPARIPCARIDFDLVAVAVAGRRPWLLLLELADQLNRQMPDAPFQELLNDRGVLRALLDLRPSRAVLSAGGQLDTEPERVAEEVVDRFARTLAETAGQRPVLLAFDTFERVLLDREGEPAAILRLLDQIRRRCPSVRLLLAGRYDLRDRVSDLRKILPRLRTATVKRFSRPEAARYLRERRGINDRALVSAMVSKSNGDPFVLALLADLARDRAGLRPEEILAYDDPQALYLVERIISRVDDPAVRWLLRYGVVPRRLSYGFVAEVMAPFLRQGMSGTSTVDDPETDRLPERGPEALFPKDVLADPQAPLNLEAVWQRLLQYAARASWVSLQPDDPGVVVFHPDLVTPMRRVLRRHPVYLRLHTAAAEYCLLQSDRPGANRLPWLLDMIYHCFQSGSRDAAQSWRTALATAEERFGLDARARVAEELLGPEYVDERGDPLPFDAQRVIVGWDILIESHLERGRVAINQARSVPAGLLRMYVERGLAAIREADRIRREHDGLNLYAPELAVVTSLAEGLLAPATALGDRVTEPVSGADPVSGFAGTELLADEVRDTDPGRASVLYSAIVGYLNDANPVAAVRVRHKSIRTLADRGRFQLALHESEGLPRPDLDTEAGALTLLDQGRVWLRAGEPAGLLALVERLPAEHAATPSAAAARDWCVAAVKMAQNEPFATLRICERALVRLASTSTGDLPRLRLELMELHALSHAAVLQIAEALGELEDVTAGWRDLGEPERSWMAAGAPADFDLRGNQTLRGQADHLATGAERNRGEGWFRSSLSALRFAVTRNESFTVDAMFGHLVEQLGPDAAPHRLVQLALVMLPTGTEDAVTMLIDNLQRIDSVPARLMLLTPLRWCRRISLTAEQHAALIELVGPQPTLDRPEALLSWAEITRLLGDHAAATSAIHLATTSWLHYFTPAHDHRDRHFWRWLLLDAAERLGHPELPIPPPVGENALHFADRASETPVLAAATLILAALRTPADPQAVHWLDRGDELLGEGGAGGSQWEVYLLLGQALAALETNQGRARVYLDHARQNWERIRPTEPLPYLDRFDSIATSSPAEPPFLDIGAVLPDWSHSQIVCRAETVGSGFLVTVTSKREPVRRNTVQSPLARPSSPSLTARIEMLVSELLKSPGDRAPLLNSLFRPFRKSAYHAPVAIAPTSTILGAVPWEFMSGTELRAPGEHPFTRVSTQELIHRHTVTVLQQGLHAALEVPLAVDGLFGPATQQAVERFLLQGGMGTTFDAHAWNRLTDTVAGHATGRPEVLVVLPGTESTLSHGRGGLREGVDLADLYRRQGFVVREAVNPVPSILNRHIREMSRGRRLAVVHIAGGFGAQHNEVYVEFASQREVSGMSKRPGEGTSTTLTSGALDRAIASLAAELPRPLIILDPGRPRSSGEAMRQLVLRNAFAHRLLEFGNIPVLLAIGLDRRDLADRRVRIAQALAQGRTADEVVRAIVGEDHGTDQIARGAAIFTHLPPYALPRWRVR